MKEEWVFAHYQTLVKVWDIVEAVKDVMNGEVPKGTQAQIVDLDITTKWTTRWFTKRIILKWYDWDYNPKKFKKVW